MASWAKPELSVVDCGAWEVEAGVDLDCEDSVFWLIWFLVPCMWPQGISFMQSPCSLGFLFRASAAVDGIWENQSGPEEKGAG